DHGAALARNVGDLVPGVNLPTPGVHLVGIGPRHLREVHDARHGGIDRLDAGTVRLQLPEPLRADELDDLHAVGHAALIEPLQAGQLALTRGHDDLAAELIGDAVRVAEARQQVAPLHAQLRLEG